MARGSMWGILLALFLLEAWADVERLTPFQRSLLGDDEEEGDDEDTSDDGDGWVTNIPLSAEEEVVEEALSVPEAPLEAEEMHATPAVEAPAKTPPPPLRRGPETYTMEMIFVSILVAFGAMYLHGKRRNEEIARKWMMETYDTFANNFAMLGDGKGAPLRCETQSEYRFHCSGRVNCIGLSAELHLKKRHDLFRMPLEVLYFKTEDTVEVEVYLNDTDMEPFVLGVVWKKEEKGFRKETPDIGRLAFKVGTQQLKDLGVPSHLSVLTDNSDAVKDLLHGEVVSLLQKNADLFNCIHFSDSYEKPDTSYKKVLRFVFKLPPPEDMTRIKPLFRMVMHFIDRVAGIRLSKDGKERAREARRRLENERLKADHSRRQELAQERKDERLRKEKEEAELLSPEQQAKRTARLAKRQMKKKLPKFKVMNYG